MSWDAGDWAEKRLWKCDRIHTRLTENLQDGEELLKPLKQGGLKDTVFPFQSGRKAGVQNYSQALPSILIPDKHWTKIPGISKSKKMRHTLTPMMARHVGDPCCPPLDLSDTLLWLLQY